jgi:hypothetical protein
MRIRKSVAGVGAAALAIAGIGVATAPSALAANGTETQNFSLYGQVNNTGLAGSAIRGTQSVTMTVSPATPNVGDPIEVTVSSSTLAFNNGPAATVQAYWSELDAVIEINGVDYVLRGARNTVASTANTAIFDAGWVVSSEPGNSIGARLGVAGTTGVGATLRGAEDTPVALTAPAVAGSYDITLKAIVNNSVSSVSPASGGSGVAGLTDDFDEITNTDSGSSCAVVATCPGTDGPGGATGSFATNDPTSFLTFTTPVSIDVAGPSATIATSTGQNAGVQAFRAPKPFWAVPSATVTLTGDTFPASQAAGTFTTAFCDVTGTTCDTIGIPNSITNTLATDVNGDLSGQITVTNGGPLSMTTGLRAIKITGGGLTVPALVPVRVLGSATLTLTPSQSFLGSAINVSGSDFNPGQAVTISGSILASVPYTASSDAPVAAGNADGNGAFTGSFTVDDAATQTVLASQGTAGLPGASNPSAVAAWEILLAAADCDVADPGDCLTTQTISATVDPGSLTQVAADPDAGGPLTATEVFLGTVEVSTSDQPLSGAMRSITVTDLRGAEQGWDLTASLKDTSFLGTTAGNEISNEEFGITGFNCAAVGGNSTALSTTGSAAQPGVDGSNGSFTFCSVNAGVAGPSGGGAGEYLVTGTFNLNIPAFQAVDTYSNTLITLLV